jgi:hypothetical protein
MSARTRFPRKPESEFPEISAQSTVILVLVLEVTTAPANQS